MEDVPEGITSIMISQGITPGRVELAERSAEYVRELPSLDIQSKTLDQGGAIHYHLT